MQGDDGASTVISIYRDLESLSLAAAALFVESARKAIAVRGRFSVALSGGSTPRRTYELLGAPANLERVDWSRTHVFWGDERCVPPEDPRSNARMARAAFLDRAPIPEGRIHPILCNESPEAEAERYDGLLRSFFGPGPPRFDLVFLGLGDNGHTASLFPYDGALHEREKLAVVVRLPDQGMTRITLTLPALNHAAKIVFLVEGAAKAQMLKAALHGPRDPERIPVQLIQPLDGETIWLADEAAASKLER